MRGQNQNIACSVCERQSSVSPCRLCSSLIVSKKSQKWAHQVDFSLHDQAQELLGGPNKTAQQRWRNLRRNSNHLKDVQWARLADETLDPVLTAPCSDDELCEIIQRVSDGIRLETLQRLYLHGGFVLHDGVRISFIGGRLLVNGRTMPAEVPIVSLLNVLSSKSARTGWDLTKLFVAFGSLNINNIENFNPQRIPPRVLRRRRFRAPIQKPSASIVFTWIEWMGEEHLTPPENYSLNPVGIWARDIRLRLGSSERMEFDQNIVEAFKHHPKGLDELNEYPWMNRWYGYLATSQFHSNRPWPFSIVEKRFKFMVRSKNDSSRRTAIPDEPGVWAFLLSSAFSPITSNAGELLYALQYNWTSPNAENQGIAAPLLRSIQFLREVIDGNADRVFIHDEHLLVIGRLGHFYEVRVGRGAHGAPFIINSIDSLESRQTHPICIHDGTFHSTVPLGDTIVSVLLTLLDDINTSAKIDSLLQHVSHYSPLGFPSKITDKHLRFFNNKALQNLKDVVTKHSPNGIIGIDWLPEPAVHERSIEYQGNQNMRNLFRRNLAYNRRIWQIEANASVQTYRTQLLIEHALAADAVLPHPQFIEFWHNSFAEITEEHREQGLHRFIHHYQGRDEWMPLRHFGRDENALPLGDIRNGERRYCEVFPRIWDALMHHPIGATFQLGALDHGALTFENCHLAVTIRNAQERRMIRRFSAVLGFVEQGRNGGSMVFVRRDHPRPQARRHLTTLLNTAQQTLGAHGAPPWWWHYQAVCETPRELPEFRWELEQDLRDQNDRNGPDDYAP
jgi:hypothetical protein